jgi:hypothetical protein
VGNSGDTALIALSAQSVDQGDGDLAIKGTGILKGMMTATVAVIIPFKIPVPLIGWRTKTMTLV